MKSEDASLKFESIADGHSEPLYQLEVAYSAEKSLNSKMVVGSAKQLAEIPAMTHDSVPLSSSGGDSSGVVRHAVDEVRMRHGSDHVQDVLVVST